MKSFLHYKLQLRSPLGYFTELIVILHLISTFCQDNGIHKSCKRSCLCCNICCHNRLMEKAQIYRNKYEKEQCFHCKLVQILNPYAVRSNSNCLFWIHQKQWKQLSLKRKLLHQFIYHTLYIYHHTESSNSNAELLLCCFVEYIINEKTKIIEKSLFDFSIIFCWFPLF